MNTNSCPTSPSPTPACSSPCGLVCAFCDSPPVLQPLRQQTWAACQAPPSPSEPHFIFTPHSSSAFHPFPVRVEDGLPSLQFHCHDTPREGRAGQAPPGPHCHHLLLPPDGAFHSASIHTQPCQHSSEDPTALVGLTAVSPPTPECSMIPYSQKAPTNVH